MPVNSKQKEIWKPVVGFEGFYEVSNLGRVKSLPRATTKGGIMKPYTNPKNGYVYVGMSKNGKRSSGKRLHVIVANTFLNAGISGYDLSKTVDHIDGDKQNNRVDNLRVVSMRENLQKAHRDGAIHYAGFETVCLDDMKVYKTYTDAARAYGGNKGEMVRRVCDGLRSHYRGLHFCRLSDFQNGTIPAFSGKNTKKVSASLWR